MSLNEREAIRNPKLLMQCSIVLSVVFIGFVLHQQIHMEPSHGGDGRRRNPDRHLWSGA